MRLAPRRLKRQNGMKRGAEREPDGGLFEYEWCLVPSLPLQSCLLMDLRRS